MVNLIEVDSFINLESHLQIKHIVELSNKNNLRFSRQRNRLHSVQSVELYIQQIRASGGKFFFISHDNKFVGTLTIDKNKKELPSIGIFLYADDQNSGRASEALSLAIEELRVEGCVVVMLGTNIANFAMRRVLEKLGFSLTLNNNGLTDLNNIYYIKELKSAL